MKLTQDQIDEMQARHWALEKALQTIIDVIGFNDKEIGCAIRRRLNETAELTKSETEKNVMLRLINGGPMGPR